jgi:hypothetical protein
MKARARACFTECCPIGLHTGALLAPCLDGVEAILLFGTPILAANLVFFLNHEAIPSVESF